MIVYIGLIVYVLVVSLLAKMLIRQKERQRDFILKLSMWAIFLLLAMKKHTVGIDIAGYKQAYEISRIIAWNDFAYFYYEQGYTLLMKVFSTMGMDFQLFAAILYGTLCLAVFFLIRRSTNPTMSLLIFICYQFLVFSMSGLRQMLAMALCVLPFALSFEGLQLRSRRSLLTCLALTCLAYTIHRSAIVFFGVIAFALIRSRSINLISYMGLFLVSLFIRPSIWSLVTEYLRDVGRSDSIQLGGNFVLLCSLVIFFYISYRLARKQNVKLNDFDVFSMRAIMLSIAGNILFSGSTMLRSSMYMSIFLLTCLPNIISLYDHRLQQFLNVLVGMFFMALFTTESLLPNQFDIIPYLFFWE